MFQVNPAEVQKYLKGIDYPAKKNVLIENAKNMGADDNVCAALAQLPDDAFQSPTDVSEAIGYFADLPDRAASGAGGNEFLAHVVRDSLGELELCELALQKTEDDSVKLFAQRMIDEHGQMGLEVEQIAGARNIELPKDLTPEHRALMKQLSKLSGPEFDREFIDYSMKAHERDMKIFRHYTQRENDSAIRLFAEKGAQILSGHLEMVKEIARQLGSGT